MSDMNGKHMNSGFGIIIVAHGDLAKHYKSVLEHVIGPQESVETVSIEDHHDRSERLAHISELTKHVDNGEGVVIVTDLYGGTPSNLALKALPENGRILYGSNMPALIKLARMRKRPIDEAMKAAVTAGHNYLNACRIDENQKLCAKEHSEGKPI